MNVVANGQSSEAHAFNPNVPHNPFLVPILFLFYINDLPKYRSLANIYAVYSCNHKNLDVHSLEADHSSDLAAECENSLVTFNISKTKLVAFYHHLLDLELSRIIINGCSFCTPCFEHL